MIIANAYSLLVMYQELCLPFQPLCLSLRFVFQRDDFVSSGEDVLDRKDWRREIFCNSLKTGQGEKLDIKCIESTGLRM